MASRDAPPFRRERLAERIAPTTQCYPQVWRNGCAAPVTGRNLAEEVAVALTYGRETHAVMMATPDALEDFAVGSA